MVRAIGSIGCVLALVTGLVTTQGVVPPDLVAMADTEREFAKTATIKGWRDAFLDFFADDALALGREVTLAKDGLRKQSSTPFSQFELVWEPRLGDVSASGDLGWLTGPSTSINHSARDPQPGHGCYLSIWRKQPDGKWRVFIDVGAGAPEPVSFASGFTRMPFGGRYVGKESGKESGKERGKERGKESKEAAGKSLASADRDLNSQIAAQGAAKAFATLVQSSSRLHRPGFTPVVGAEAIAGWLNEHAVSASAKDGAAEAAAAGDFGYTYGTFEITAPKPLSGAYLRLWNRDASGRWWLTVDVAQPFRP
jgi:ketosteroid isomerase-like protein